MTGSLLPDGQPCSALSLINLLWTLSVVTKASCCPLSLPEALVVSQFPCAQAWTPTHPMVHPLGPLGGLTSHPVLLSGSGVSPHDTSPSLSALIRYIRPVFVSRSDQDSRRRTVEEIKRRAQSNGKWPQVTRPCLCLSGFISEGVSLKTEGRRNKRARTCLPWGLAVFGFLLFLMSV